jgi:hypothetical protein
VKPEFEACSNVKILKNDLSPAQRMEYIVNARAQNLQRMPKMEFLNGISDPRSIATSIHLLQMVTDKKLQNISAHLEYYAEIKNCLQNPTTSAECGPLLNQFQQNMATAIPALRRELALSLHYTAGVDYSSVPRAHMNVVLRSVKGLPNPAGRSVLTEQEYKTAESDFAKDLQIVKTQVEKELSTFKKTEQAYDETQIRIGLLQAGFLAQMLKHQATYLKILNSQPILAFLPNGSLNTMQVPAEAQILEAIARLQKSGEEEIRSVQATRDDGKLEFTRFNGEAVWRAYIKGDVELLQFVTSPLMNDVLKENPQHCAMAQQLLQRVSLKQMQNYVVTSAIFGVGNTAGLLDYSIKGFMTAAQYSGLLKTLSIASVLQTSNRITMGVMITGGAIQSFRDKKHDRANQLTVPVAQ